MAEISYRRRFPPAIIQYAVWVYLRFTLSSRDVEELLAERGLDISYETFQCWVLKFGPVIARQLRRHRPRSSNRWHLHEMVERIGGKRMYLWRAVDHEGEVLDMLVQTRRDSRAAAADAQVAQETRLRAEIAGHRQAALLRLGVPAITAELSPPTRTQTKQSGGELASGGATTRAQNAAVQVGALCAALSQHACGHPQHLRPPTPSRLTRHAAGLPSRGGRPRGAPRSHISPAMATRLRANGDARKEAGSRASHEQGIPRCREDPLPRGTFRSRQAARPEQSEINDKKDLLQ